MSVRTPAQQPETTGAHLSIGDLATAAGVSPGTLRMWETRFGFPVPTRLPSGHRRYDVDDVERVKDVLARQHNGLRLEKAIAAVRVRRHADEPSVFASVRATAPRLPRQRLRKSTLIALSHAIEDEMCSRGRRGFAFGAFQRASYFAGAAGRWDDIARRSHAAVVLADFTDSGVPVARDGADHPFFVPLESGAPLREEWAVVCDSPAFSGVLSAWEPPGQVHDDHHDRLFEAVWTLDPEPVRQAAQVCLDIAEASDRVEGVAALRAALVASPTATAPTPQQLTEFCDRVIVSMDRRGRR
jgi:MerR family transcriptional regulator, light-induced transcriptional regulator